MSQDTSFEDYSLLDMFRSEVETHSDLLSAALLALERSPNDTSRIEEMMRAAHSIKGASRVVGVDPAVTVAHIMEDCFVAAQSGAIAFSPEDIDVLLRGVDLLGKISAATRDPNVDLTRDFGGPVDSLAAQLQGVLSGSGKSREVIAEVGDAAFLTAPPSAVDQSLAAIPHATHQASLATDVTIVFPEILDLAAAEAIRGQFLSAIDSRCPTIRFDLQATRDLDVHGLSLLAAIPSHLAKHSRASLQLVGLSVEMATVLRVTGLAARFGDRRPAPREAE